MEKMRIILLDKDKKIYNVQTIKILSSICEKYQQQDRLKNSFLDVIQKNDKRIKK